MATVAASPDEPVKFDVGERERAEAARAALDALLGAAGPDGIEPEELLEKAERLMADLLKWRVDGAIARLILDGRIGVQANATGDDWLLFSLATTVESE